MNEEALLARAAEERERIFQRYERGRENLAGQIDPWEDPEFEEYHKTDRLVIETLYPITFYLIRKESPF